MDNPTNPSAKASPRPREARTLRRLGALVLAIAALIVIVALAPNDTVTSGDISKVMVDDTLNQARTEGAPQQAVVNGWTARDLLELTAKQGVEARDHRPAALLTLLVLGMCLALATSEPGAPRPYGPGELLEPLWVPRALLGSAEQDSDGQGS